MLVLQGLHHHITKAAPLLVAGSSGGALGAMGAAGGGGGGGGGGASGSGGGGMERSLSASSLNDGGAMGSSGGSAGGGLGSDGEVSMSASTEWPDPYVATQQVGLSLLCSFVTAIPPELAPVQPLSELTRTLEAFGPLRLFDDWAGAQRLHAEVDVDLASLPNAVASCSSCHSSDSVGPHRAMQRGSSYWGSKARKNNTEVKRIATDRNGS